MAETGDRRAGTIFRNIRIAVLVSVLGVVLIYAWNDVRRRKARTEWQSTVQVALVLLEREPVQAAAMTQIKTRAPELENRLTAEMARYSGMREPRPFSFTIYGPIAVTAPPPRPADDSVAELARHAWNTWLYFRDVDRRAEVEWRAADSRIYLVLRPPENERRKTVEGQSEQGGRVGSVEVELDESMVDFALFVATHELFHTLGATDKYDLATGQPLTPAGLGEPARQPLFPQDFGEIMAGRIAASAHDAVIADSLEQMLVGPVTALEIGWSP